MAWWLFQNVVVTAGLALAVAAICRTSRIGPVGRHALWLVVLVKFVTPPLVVWPWAVPDPLRLAMVGEYRAGETGRPGAPEPAGLTAVDGTPAVADAHEPGESAAGQVTGLAAFWPWLLAFWVAGSLGLAAIESVRLVRLWRRAREGVPADAALTSRVDAVAERLGLRPVRVRVVPGGAPVVWCFGRPELLWPATLSATASELCIEGLLVHELAHIKRRDHLVGWLELVAGVVWWWNPLFWFVRSALREQAELACDAWVTSALPNGRRAYAESLLALSGATAPGSAPMAIVGIRAISRRVLERRLVMIMQGRAPLRLTRVGLVSLALMAAATMPGWAASQDPPPPTPPVPVRVQQAPPTPTPLSTPPLPSAAPTARVVTPRQVPPTPSLPPRPMIVQTPPLPAQPVIVTPAPSRNLYAVRTKRATLPADGQALLTGFDTDVEAIQREASERVEARRQALITALEDLQDQYTKAGKLDEAVAIRDFLKAGGPGGMKYVIRKINR